MEEYIYNCIKIICHTIIGVIGIKELFRLITTLLKEAING